MDNRIIGRTVRIHPSEEVEVLAVAFCSGNGEFALLVVGTDGALRTVTTEDPLDLMPPEPVTLD